MCCINTDYKVKVVNLSQVLRGICDIINKGERKTKLGSLGVGEPVLADLVPPVTGRGKVLSALDSVDPLTGPVESRLILLLQLSPDLVELYQRSSLGNIILGL